eukprot:Plantae.Rhodophyta-Hildenbrandia_rubra.ctg1443.p1 GENE.Plantae.Rhodophyta-Hildenbrandia_rubra.ctg1443~~Plantae.Rhodophyta-Hildenbrandia_rubra.ctg1443.p1  ORF type:complete len:286 (-),score=60.26 Plantae.Rhodophyta-Hildenbrandia_rubra.ctg1443:1369-2226(-)
MWRSTGGPRRRESPPDHHQNGFRPSLPFPPTTTKHSLLPRFQNDAPFFWLLVALLATFIIFFSLLRGHHISLNSEQVAEFEKRYQVLSNSSVYIVEVKRAEKLLSKFSVGMWNVISKDVEFVAFVYDDLPLFLVDEWVMKAEGILKGSRRKESEMGVGIVLFGCGCVVPNRLFRMVEWRLDGLECLLLPGFVLDKEDVHWIDSEVGGRCKRRKEVLRSGGLHKYAQVLMNLRGKVVEWKRAINGSGTGAGGGLVGKVEQVEKVEKEGGEEIARARVRAVDDSDFQ